MLLIVVFCMVASWWSQKAIPNLVHLKDDMTREINDGSRKFRLLRQRAVETFGYGERTVDLELQVKEELTCLQLPFFISFFIIYKAQLYPPCIKPKFSFLFFQIKKISGMLCMIFN